MTGLPEKLILMGDGYESDLLIYLSLTIILQKKMDPWNLWNRLRKEKAFKLNTFQNTRFLNKIYQLHTLITMKKDYSPEVRIYIRYKDKLPKKTIPYPFLEEVLENVSYYQA